MLPLENRITSPVDFQKTLNSGQKDYQKSIAVFLNQTTKPSRLGLIVSRKVGNAVKRHLLSRRAREVFKKVLIDYPNGLDIVVKFSTKFNNPNFNQIETEFKQAIKNILERKIVEN